MGGENTNKRQLTYAESREAKRRKANEGRKHDPLRGGLSSTSLARTQSDRGVSGRNHVNTREQSGLSSTSFARPNWLDPLGEGEPDPSKNFRDYTVLEENNLLTSHTRASSMSRGTRASSESRASDILDERRRSPLPRPQRLPNFVTEPLAGTHTLPGASFSATRPFKNEPQLPLESGKPPYEMNAPFSRQVPDFVRGPFSRTHTLPEYSSSRPFMDDPLPPMHPPHSYEPFDPRNSFSRTHTLPEYSSSRLQPRDPRPFDASRLSKFHKNENEPIFVKTAFPDDTLYSPPPDFPPSQERQEDKGKMPMRDVVIPIDREVPTRASEIPVGFLNFKVGDVLDMPYRAKELRQFIKHGPIEDIYCALQKMHGEIETIDSLRNAYHVNSLKEYNLKGRNLYEDLYKRLEVDNINPDYVNQLLGKHVNPDSPYKFDTPPQSVEDYTKFAHRIQNALGSSDMKSVYATLTPLRRRTEYIFKLEDSYQKLFHEDLHDRVRDQLLGPSRDYTLYLLRETKMETPFFTPIEADKLAQKLSQVTFVGNDDKQHKLPFKYPEDGCKYRTYVMSEAMSEMGFANNRTIIDAVTAPKGLRVETRHGRDTPSLQPSAKWRFHTTSTIEVMLESSDKFPRYPKIETKIMDLSISEDLMSVGRWVNHMGYSDYTEMSIEKYKEFWNDKNKSPNDKPIVLFTSRYVRDLDWIPAFHQVLINNKTRVIAHHAWDAYQKYGVADLTKFSLLEKQHERAAKFRLDLDRGATEEVRELLESLENQPEELANFAKEFPRLLQEIRDQVGPPVITVSDPPHSFLPR